MHFNIYFNTLILKLVTSASKEGIFAYFVPGMSKWVPPSHLQGTMSQNIWLFNITADPTEHKDLSETHPEIVKQLLDRLAYYNSTAVPCIYPKRDPQSNPKLHGGAWVPWRD